MKCKQCGAEMLEWQRTKSVDYDRVNVIVRYRCEVCTWESSDLITDGKAKPKPKEQED